MPISSFKEELLGWLDDVGHNKKKYLIEYETFSGWILDSIDGIKYELIHLLLPLYCLSYITLMVQNHLEDANRFKESFQYMHLETYAYELTELFVVATESQLSDDVFLNQHLFIKQCMESKFRMTIATYAYDILLSTLIRKNLTLLSSIISEKIIFHKIDSTEILKSGHLGMNKMELLGYTPGADKAINLSTLCLGVPGKGNKYSLPNTKDDPLYKDWIKKLVEPRLFLEKSKLAGGTKSATVAGKEWRGNPLEPSIIFSTVANTYGDATCLHINGEITQAIAGFRDSIVRVWRLGERHGSTSSSSSRRAVAAEGVTETTTTSSSSSSSSVPTSDHFKSVKRHINDVLPPNAKRSDYSLHDDSGDRTTDLIGHSGPVYGVSQDPSTPRVVLSCSSDRAVRIWDLATTQAMGKYSLLTPVWGVAMAPLGYYFATATHDGSISVFATDNYTPFRIMTGHIADASSVAWHPNCSLLLSGSDDRTCRLWDLRSGKCERLLTGCPSSVCSVAVSSEGGLAAAGCENGSVCVWDLTSGRLKYLLSGHTSYVNSVGFNEDDVALISGSSDCSVNIWDLQKTSTYAGQSIGDTLLLQPHKSFSTKYTPVMHVGYSKLNLAYAGGPFDVASAPDRAVSSIFSEEQAIKKLGIGQAIPLE